MQNQQAKNLSLRLTLQVASIMQNNNVYKDLSRISKLRTSPSTDALSLCQEYYYNNLNFTYKPNLYKSNLILFLITLTPFKPVNS